MKKLATAPNNMWFLAWLQSQGESPSGWLYITSIRHLYGYRNVELHIIVGYPSGFEYPNGWEDSIAIMKSHNITEIREV